MPSKKSEKKSSSRALKKELDSAKLREMLDAAFASLGVPAEEKKGDTKLREILDAADYANRQMSIWLHEIEELVAAHDIKLKEEETTLSIFAENCKEDVLERIREQIVAEAEKRQKEIDRKRKFLEAILNTKDDKNTTYDSTTVDHLPIGEIPTAQIPYTPAIFNAPFVSEEGKSVKAPFKREDRNTHSETPYELLMKRLDSSITSLLPADWRNKESIVTAIENEPQSSSADDLLKPLTQSKEYIVQFVIALAKLKKMQESTLSKIGYSSRLKYFQDHISVFNLSPQELDLNKKEIRRKLFDVAREYRDGSTLILSIDPFSDITDTSTIESLGFFLQWPEGGVYAPEISESLFTYGAIHFANDTNMCAFRLGHHYDRGNTGRVDHNAALFWFDVATKLGHGVAPKFMYQILASEDKRFGDPNEPDFNEYMNSLMQKAEDMGFPCSQEWINRRYAFGTGKYNDQKRVISGYERIIEEQFLAPPQLSSLLSYAMRTVLFDNTNRNYDDIVTNIVTGVQKNKLQSFYTSHIEIPFMETRKIVEKIRISNEYTSNFRALGSWVRAYYHQEVSKEEFDATIDKVMSAGQSSAAEAYRDALWLGRTLAREEGWYITNDIADSFEKVHAMCLGLDDEKLKRSAMIMGPFYNPIDPENGLPILGEHLPASQSDEEVQQQYVTMGAFVPKPGIIAIKSVRGVSYKLNPGGKENDSYYSSLLGESGSIEFDFDYNDTSPAFILDEDIKVAKALAFGDKDKPLWPSLSLESKDTRLLPDSYEQFSLKVWNPAWLGHTAFGKTLYIVDRLAGQITWHPRSFTIATPEDSFHPDFPEYITDLLEDLRFTGGADRASHRKLINVSPEYIPLKIQKSFLRDMFEFDPETWKVPLDTIKMRVNGSYTMERDGKDIRDIGWNDTSFGQGRLTQRLTDHYNEIALMMPVFERARQLAGLTYGLMKLRNEGFKLGNKSQNEVSQTLEHYRSLPPLGRDELIMKPQPFKLDFLAGR